ncbi:MAG: aminopeptidase P family protein [Protaetiibacter sp.]
MADSTPVDTAAPATAPAASNRSTTPGSDAFREFIFNGWADRPEVAPSPRPQAAFAAARRLRLAAAFPGATLVIPAGPARVRSNDTDYPYRAHSAFSHLTGWASDTVPGSVLVIGPGEDAPATVFFTPTAGRESEEFYANPAIGEFWTGPRPSLAHVAAELALETRPLGELAVTGEQVLVLRGVDSAADELAEPTAAEAELLRTVSELRLVKDEYEIAELRNAIEATRIGFGDVVADLPRIIAHPRGERLVEGTFNRRARAEGNTVGYDTIAASGPHACTLHWTRNDGPVVPGELLLLDAGVELDSLYTADITRTLPVSGSFTEVQRRVYEAVREAADAAFRIVRPGIRFREIHAEAMKVIAAKTAEWGLLPVSAEESLDPDAQYHRRYMVHGTSHHLGIDVHDCAQARRELYLDGVLEPGMVFTIEPGLYFQPDDLTVPDEYRGIGVRIEDDILVTADGAENLSAGIPRTADEVEAWLADPSRWT